MPIFMDRHDVPGVTAADVAAAHQNDRWNDGQFRVEDLARLVGKSKSQLYRTLTSLTGYSPKELLRDFRLRKASELLETRRGNVTEVAFETGFSSAAYFSKSFQERFGMLPSAYSKVTH